MNAGPQRAAEDGPRDRQGRPRPRGIAHTRHDPEERPRSPQEARRPQDSRAGGRARAGPRTPRAAAAPRRLRACAGLGGRGPAPPGGGGRTARRPGARGPRMRASRRTRPAPPGGGGGTGRATGRAGGAARLAPRRRLRHPLPSPASSSGALTWPRTQESRCSVRSPGVGPAVLQGALQRPARPGRRSRRPGAGGLARGGVSAPGRPHRRVPAGPHGKRPTASGGGTGAEAEGAPCSPRAAAAPRRWKGFGGRGVEGVWGFLRMLCVRAQPSLTLCDLTDCNLPGFIVHGKDTEVGCNFLLQYCQ